MTAAPKPPRLTIARVVAQLERPAPLVDGQEEIPDLELKLRPVDPPPEAA